MVRVEEVWGFVCSPVDHDLKGKTKHVFFGVSVSLASDLVFFERESRRRVWDLGSVVGTECYSLLFWVSWNWLCHRYFE